jgi:hypothetical protein
MQILPKLYINVRSSAMPHYWEFFDLWPLKEGTDEEDRPHITFLIHWEYDEVCNEHLDMNDS